MGSGVFYEVALLHVELTPGFSSCPVMVVSLSARNRVSNRWARNVGLPMAHSYGPCVR